jgi:pimeloyl-ACP methyl ester carboxylesterase
MMTFAGKACSLWKQHQAGRLLPVLALITLSLLGVSSPAQAARECEHPYYVPSEGACARLPAAELFYYDTGPVRGKGETVIFLHAASGNADAFKHNLDAFRAAGYRAIAYDRKNVGRSSNTLRDDALGRSRGSTVQDLEDLANHLGLDKFHLVGVAAGGQVALQYVAARNPGRVLSLVLSATLGPPGLAANEPALATLQSDISLPFEIFCPMRIANPPPLPLQLVSTTTAATVDIPEVLAEHRELGSWFRATNQPGVEEYRRIAENARHGTSEGCRFTNTGANQSGLATADPRNPTTFAKIASLITVRTLLLAGTGDVFFSPPVHMRLWGSYIRDVQYTQLDTGHAPQLEDPEHFNDAVLRFLSGGHPFERLTKGH